MVKISVIIPVYNSEEYIIKCIDSVKNQSLKELEIICVDDGSSDNTCSIIEKMQIDDDRILLFSIKHNYAGNARNYGIKMAKGDFIAFLDSDDFYVNNCALEQLYLFGTQYDANICAANLLFYDVSLDYTSFFEFELKRIFENKKIEWIDFIDVQDDFFFTRYIYKRRFLVDNNIFFPHYRKYEDPTFLLRAMCIEKKFLYIPINFYCYRVHYKFETISKEQLMDILCGIYDNMQLSYNNNYTLLYNKLIDRLFNEYRRYIIKYWSTDVSSLFMRIIDFHVDNHSGDNILIQTINQFADFWNYSQYVFPYHLFNKNDKIILCGTGSVYKSFSYQLSTIPHFLTVLAMVDCATRNWSNILEQLHNNEYDYILIALKNKNQFEAIKKILFKYNISDNKIKWDGGNYKRDNFYKNILFNINA